MSLGKISYVAIIRVFIVEDHGDGFVVGYDFGCGHGMALMCLSLVLLYCFLSISHF